MSNTRVSSSRRPKAGAASSGTDPQPDLDFNLNDRWVRDAAVGGNIAATSIMPAVPTATLMLSAAAIWIIVARRIATGEELTYDYNTAWVRRHSVPVPAGLAAASCSELRTPVPNRDMSPLTSGLLCGQTGRRRALLLCWTMCAGKVASHRAGGAMGEIRPTGQETSARPAPEEALPPQDWRSRSSTPTDGQPVHEGALPGRRRVKTS